MTIDFRTECKKHVAQGYLTNSKNPDTDFPFVPSHFDHANAGYIFHGNKAYVDMVAALGAYHWEIPRMHHSGDTLMIGSSIQEITCALTIKNYFNLPTYKVKFVNDGSESCMAAVRIARTATQRAVVLSEGYHGWLDEFTGLNSNCVGIPDLNRRTMQTFKLEDYKSIEQHVAAVILEPVQLDNSLERINLLRELIDHCKKIGVIVIFDEVITGLRYPGGSVTRWHNLEPDLICCGKAFGNGEKAGFVIGRGDLMDMDYFVSGTYFGHLPTLGEIAVSCQREQDQRFSSSKLNEMAREANAKIQFDEIKIVGWGARANIVGTDENVALFRQEMFKRGWYTKTTLIWNWRNIHARDKFVYDSTRTIEEMRNGTAKLEYPIPVKGVAQKVREAKND